MFPFLSALSGIAGSIGLPALANGLNAVGGMAGGSMPFSMTPGTAANGGWSTTTTPSPMSNPMTNLTGAQAGQQQQSPIPQTQAPEIPGAPPQQGPVDISQLLSILQNRSRLGA